MGAARASVCEQCHLVGETRVPNPGKAISDFRPGQTLEMFYYNLCRSPCAPGRAVLRLSAMPSSWLSANVLAAAETIYGAAHATTRTINRPSYAPTIAIGALTCHVATLAKARTAPGRDCVACTTCPNRRPLMEVTPLYESPDCPFGGNECQRSKARHADSLARTGACIARAELGDCPGGVWG